MQTHSNWLSEIWDLRRYVHKPGIHANQTIYVGKPVHAALKYEHFFQFFRKETQELSNENRSVIHAKQTDYVRKPVPAALNFPNCLRLDKEEG